MTPSNHGEVASGLLRPYVSPANAWTLANHEVFQGYYYYHHVGGDRNAREVFKDNPYYQRTVDICHKYDQPSFDPEYKSESLDVFVPMVEVSAHPCSKRKRALQSTPRAGADTFERGLWR